VGEAGVEVGEAFRAEEQVANDQQRPALADEIERWADEHPSP
jgi:hypothetical protein